MSESFFFRLRALTLPADPASRFGEILLCLSLETMEAADLRKSRFRENSPKTSRSPETDSAALLITDRAWVPDILFLFRLGDASFRKSESSLNVSRFFPQTPSPQ